MKVKIKKLHPDAVIPKYSKYGDAGLDLTAVSKKDDDYGNIVYHTGLCFEIPHGYVGLLFPRSSNAKTHLLLSNSVGVLDSGYRGEVLFKYKKTYNDVIEDSLYHNVDYNYYPGDRIGQILIMPYPQIVFEEVEELSESERGSGGYGSTGK